MDSARKWAILSEEAASKVIMFDYLAQTFGLAAGAFGRISFIVFILGLLTSRLWQQVVLWILVALQITVNAVFIVILFVQCPGHQSAIWQHSDKEKCWSTHVQADYGYVQGGFNAATDLYLALFSTVIFWRLNLKVRVKLGLVALLGLGLFAMAAAIIKTVQTRILATPDTDPTIATVNYDRWLFIETYLVIITASIPNIRSLLKSRKSKGSTQHTHELSSRYASGSRHSGRIRGRVSSIDGKRMVNADETASDDETWRRDEHDSTYESQCSRESVIICV
ncbi:hypothetical protein N7470_009294 [Penicillium chermesinum]|nr:hypothetical protein N7470_009294 [Penicillium chermesinum]